jgi:class 3 adenylate cyclase
MQFIGAQEETLVATLVDDDDLQSAAAHDISPLNFSCSDEIQFMFFHHAASGDLNNVMSLLGKRISINSLDYNGRSALHLSAERGYLELVTFLLGQGADHTLKDIFGNTAQDLAQKGNHHLEVEALRQAQSLSVRSQQTQSIGDGHARLMHARFAILERFPRSVADALLEGKHIEPISKGMTTVLFIEIVEFYEMKSIITLENLSKLLSGLHRALDKLAYIHGVQKIDVLGEVYLAATNFSESQPTDHAARMARFAVAALKAARDIPDEAGTPLRLRVGLHSGPVAGGLVGWQGLKFTLVGDTVNVASRIQSTSLPGRVQCSAVAARLIAEQASDIALQQRCHPDPPHTHTHTHTHPKHPLPTGPTPSLACKAGIDSGVRSCSSRGRTQCIPPPPERTGRPL